MSGTSDVEQRVRTRAAAGTAAAAPVPSDARRDRLRGDVVVTLVSGLLLLVWDAAGWDLMVMREVGKSDGFPLREAWWTSRMLHDGGRNLAWGLLAVLVLHTAWCALRGQPAHRAGRAPSPGVAERWRWIGAMLLIAVGVPAIKRISHTSCPWDLQEFGGNAAYVSHWNWALADGGSGHCFPSGHAVAAFAFFGLYFLWRGCRPGLARGFLAAVCMGGVLFGGAQLLRGAHYPSHTMWTAWLSWTICVMAARWLPAAR